ELPGVVVTVPELERVVGQAIPFLARDLAGLAPDAKRRVRKESDRLCHGSVPHQVGCDLGQALVACVKVERQRRDLVHHGHRARVTAQVEGEQILPARLAAVDAGVRELLLLLEDREFAAIVLAASCAGHAGECPVARASRADEVARAADQSLAGNGEVRQLRQPSAIWTVQERAPTLPSPASGGG